MHIAGVVVDALPEKGALVEQQLAAMVGVEVHAVAERGRMVVTVEGDSPEQVADTVTALHGLNGVLAAAMVYHSFEQTCRQESAA